MVSSTHDSKRERGDPCEWRQHEAGHALIISFATNSDHIARTVTGMDLSRVHWANAAAVRDAREWHSIPASERRAERPSPCGSGPAGQGPKRAQGDRAAEAGRRGHIKIQQTLPEDTVPHHVAFRNDRVVDSHRNGRHPAGQGVDVPGPEGEGHDHHLGVLDGRGDVQDGPGARPAGPPEPDRAGSGGGHEALALQVDAQGLAGEAGELGGVRPENPVE